jgi:cytochrome b561
MALRNGPSSWGHVSRFFHWTMAVLIIASSIFVLHVNDSMPWFKSSVPVFLVYLHWHKAVGLLLLAMAVARLLWRRTDPAPKVAVLDAREEKLAKAAHRALYILMIVVPLSGWIASSAFGSVTKVFGLFEIPGIIPKTKPLVGPAYWAHFSLAWALLALVSFHIVAAFWHHDRRRDDTLRAMWSGRRRTNPAAPVEPDVRTAG